MGKVIIHALKAWLIGLLFSGLVAIPLSTATRGISFENIGDQLIERFLVFFGIIPSGLLLTFTFGIFLSFPLLIIAMIFAIVLRNFIAKYRLLFSILAPAIAASLVAAVDAHTRDNNWANSRGFWEKFQHIFFTWDTWIFALPVFAAALYFCYFYPTIQSGSNE